MPATFTQGLLSGLGHPVIGLDHLAALIAVGCLAGLLRRGPLLVSCFVVAMGLGAGLHIGELSLPGSEILVVMSVVALGAALVAARSVPWGLVLLLFALVGLLHGYALAESVIGAERTPLLAYLVGLVVVQTALGLVIMMIARLAVAKAGVLPLRLAGACIAGIGIVLTGSQL
jgi:urease accessory protein